MEIFLNGKQVQTSCGTLADLTLEQHVETQFLIVEINGTVIPEQDWKTHPVSAGDRVELLHFVGGG
ncbi:sulfur carrier protein ThiS [Desulfomarina sp.]